MSLPIQIIIKCVPSEIDCTREKKKMVYLLAIVKYHPTEMKEEEKSEF